MIDKHKDEVQNNLILSMDKICIYYVSPMWASDIKYITALGMSDAI